MSKFQSSCSNPKHSDLLQCLIKFTEMLGFDLSLTLKYRHFQQDFIDLGRIGAGGFARVHKVQSRLDQNLYALKIIEIKPSECKADLIDTIHKFLDEVKTLSFLNHKNVIQYHGCWVEAELLDEDQRNSSHSEAEEKVEPDEEIIMVMEEQFSSSGIQFDYSQNSNQPQQKNGTSSIVGKSKPQVLDIPYDHSAASTNIRKTYKLLRIFIMSELAQSNIQSYLYQRNLSRKNHANEKNNQLNNGSKPNFCSPVPVKGKFLKQQKPRKDELIENYRMILQITEGLEYLHSKKVIHRDVKLHNIVIDKNKICKIIDYGLAKKARMLQSISEYPKDFSSIQNSSSQESDEVFSSSVGTRIYSSPQQINSQKYDHRTDIYSLAIVILMFFCDFTTNHEELQIIEKIRKNDLGFIQCDERLKEIMGKCLGEEKLRPRLCEIRGVVRGLLRERYQQESNKLTENIAISKLNALQKQENIYIMENSKLKKKMSRDDYLSFSQGLKKQQSSTSSNSGRQPQEEKIFQESTNTLQE